jgi:YD repeat-containing protein
MPTWYYYYLRCLMLTRNSRLLPQWGECSRCLLWYHWTLFNETIELITLNSNGWQYKYKYHPFVKPKSKTDNNKHEHFYHGLGQTYQ